MACRKRRVGLCRWWYEAAESISDLHARQAEHTERVGSFHDIPQLPAPGAVSPEMTWEARADLAAAGNCLRVLPKPELGKASPFSSLGLLSDKCGTRCELNQLLNLA